MVHSKSKNAPLYLRISDQLRHAISDGTIPEGARLGEGNLMKAINTGRTPSRHALKQLVKEGLLREEPRNGFVVGTSAEGSKDYFNLSQYAEKLSGEHTQTKTRDEIEREAVYLAVSGNWKINASALAQHTGLSRSQTDVVLTLLQSQGVVTSTSSCRWIVPHLNATRLDQIFMVRRCLEPALLGEAVINIPRDALAEIEAAHRDALNRFPNVTAKELDTLEMQIHDDILSYSENAVGMSALQAAKISLLFSKHIMATKAFPLGRDEPFLSEHLEILGAIQRRDSEEARLRLQAHLIKSRTKVANRLSQLAQKSISRPPPWVSPLNRPIPK